MKNIFTSACLFLILSTANAQTAATDPEQLRVQAAVQARELAQQIGLNGLEYITIRNYTLQKLIAAEQVRQLYAHDARLRAAKLAAVEEEFLQKMVATLTPRQHLNLVALRMPK